jgi:hypothetical protein
MTREKNRFFRELEYLPECEIINKKPLYFKWESYEELIKKKIAPLPCPFKDTVKFFWKPCPLPVTRVCLSVAAVFATT